ncbi:MAG: class II glutamine amidotransferase [Firmicutes bacterium]|nr:class II glutamine amidotransferase [Bacillota bacterium]
MCELFGVSARESFRVNELLDAFYHHSDEHRDGWGLAVFRGHGVSMEKEPVKATNSAYLIRRMSRDIEAANLFAHIRLATIGRIEYCNCHPFIWDDESGRTWTMIHNGTFFNGSKLTGYIDRQEGTTDSERFLLYIVDAMSAAYEKKGAELTFDERFEIIDDIIVALSDDNKINMLLYDGDYMYVHTNCEGSLYCWREEGKRIFATRPVVMDGWEQLPLNRLLVYKNGEMIREGTVHSNSFRDEDHDYAPLMSAFSEL